VCTYYIYDGDKPIVEETYSGSTATISAVNVWGADGWRARYYPVGSPNFYSFTFDPQGNVIEKQQAINTTIPAYTITSYEAYGKFGANLLYSTGVRQGPGNLYTGGSSPRTATYAYDNVGNPTTFLGTSPTFTTDNQIDDTPDFTYDGNGNPTEYSSSVPSGSTLAYDAENRLLSASGTSFGADYDADGLRTYKATGATTPIANGYRFYIYDGDTRMLELDSSGDVVQANGWAADGLRELYNANGDDHYYEYTYDPEGNVNQRQSQNNTTSYSLNTSVYDAYGKLLHKGGTSPSNESGSIGLAGEWGGYTDIDQSNSSYTTGLVEMGHRYYDPLVGRFLNRDPIDYNGGINLYSYAGNNPITGSDPSGLTVSAIFDRAAGTLQIWDDSNPNDKITISDVKGSKDKSKSQAVFSGEGQYMNDPNSEQVPSMGPIPAGEYLISHMFVAGDMGKHFQLYSDATDWQYHGNRTWLLNHILSSEAPGRHNFNFHSGRVSEGCVTVWSTLAKGQSGYPDSPTWENILSLIRRSGTTTGAYTYLNEHLVKGHQNGGEFVNNGPYTGVLIVK
jgi:RHS repeat-associated protein